MQELIKEARQNQRASNEEMFSAEEIEPTSYYYENIFSLEDFYLYRGVVKFYQGDYEKAVLDFNKSEFLKQSGKDH